MLVGTYCKFLVNGIGLGVLALLLQFALFEGSVFGEKSAMTYALSNGSTCIFISVINFYIQSKIIFRKRGSFFKYVVTNALMMILVVQLAPFLSSLARYLFSPVFSATVAFGSAAVIGSALSFLLNKVWVFVGE